MQIHVYNNKVCTYSQQSCTMTSILVFFNYLRYNSSIAIYRIFQLSCAIHWFVTCGIWQCSMIEWQWYNSVPSEGFFSDSALPSHFLHSHLWAKSAEQKEKSKSAENDCCTDCRQFPVRLDNNKNRWLKPLSPTRRWSWPTQDGENVMPTSCLQC